MVVALGAATVPPGIAASSRDPYDWAVTAVRPVDTPPGPNCPPGWLCFYAGDSFGYPRAQLRPCGWVDLTRYSWHRIRSVHQNLTNPADLFAPVHGPFLFHFDRPGDLRAHREFIEFVSGLRPAMFDNPYLPATNAVYYDCTQVPRLCPQPSPPLCGALPAARDDSTTAAASAAARGRRDGALRFCAPWPVMGSTAGLDPCGAFEQLGFGSGNPLVEPAQQFGLTA